MDLISYFKNLLNIYNGIYLSLIIILLQYLYNKPELINKSLYFFEISFAAVLFPLADSPSQAIINFFNLAIRFNKLFYSREITPIEGESSRNKNS